MRRLTSKVMIPGHHKDVAGTRKFFVFSALLSPAPNGRVKCRHANDKDTFISTPRYKELDLISKNVENNVKLLLGALAFSKACKIQRRNQTFWPKFGFLKIYQAITSSKPGQQEAIYFEGAHRISATFEELVYCGFLALKIRPGARALKSRLSSLGPGATLS